ncbi:MAG TPA: hypothetical protein PLD25_20565 [Chloroflexota bacterium]|nr:hypothetical protein [Chloroflexota bacterium]
MMTVDTPPRIDIEAQIMGFMPSAMTDDFEDNRFAVFDAAILTVLRPIDRANRQLIVYQPHPADAHSLWRQVGSRIAFQIAAEMLTPEMMVFESAIHDLRVTEIPKDMTEAENE